MSKEQKIKELWIFVEDHGTGNVSYYVWWADDPYKPKPDKEMSLLGEITDTELAVLRKFDMVDDHTDPDYVQKLKEGKI